METRMPTGQRKQEPCLFSDLCPLFHPITGPSHLAVSGSAIPVGSPSEETAGAPPGHRLQPPFPSTSAECLGGTFMHFVSPSQLLAPLPPQLDPVPNGGRSCTPQSSLHPLCFLEKKASSITLFSRASISGVLPKFCSQVVWITGWNHHFRVAKDYLK